MNRYLKIGLAAAAVVIVAVVGYQFLPGAPGLGANATPSPSLAPVSPSQSPALLARGSFTVPGDNVTELVAVGDGPSVTGTLTVSDAGGRVSVDLECTRTTEGGLIVIAGTVSASTHDDFPEGIRYAIILQRGSPVGALFMFEDADAPSATCLAFLEGDIDGLFTADLMRIEGTIDLRP